MLKTYSETLLLFLDWITLSCSWLLAYYVRFYIPIIPAHKGIPSFYTYVTLLIVMIPLWFIVFKFLGLDRPRRIPSKVAEVVVIAKATSIATLILITLTFFVARQEFSRVFFLYFWIISIVALCITRALFREFLRLIRKRGYNLRYALIVGTGNLGQDITDKIRRNPELGIKIRGFLCEDTSQVGKAVKGYQVLDTYENIRTIITNHKIDMVLIALPLNAHEKLKSIIDDIADEMVSIIMVPDLFEFTKLRGGFSGSFGVFEGMPIINLIASPLYGWNRVIKRITDILLSLVIILVTFPLMLVIAILIKVTSKGPVLFPHERMGLDGKVFTMLKYRTMKIEAEEETGPIWATENDHRRTLVGTFLRKTSLDELPQFYNVMKGDMSIVGPRPERPHFIQEFRSKIPKYMLRHTMKAGITGWAQVNGWRGNTSLEKRIEYDLYYIENWELKFDFEIMWLTVWRGFIGKNAY
jgi:Undecaprenyl-phosphate glucose phosphotransferase